MVNAEDLKAISLKSFSIYERSGMFAVLKIPCHDDLSIHPFSCSGNILKIFMFRMLTKCEKLRFETRVLLGFAGGLESFGSLCIINNHRKNTGFR